MKLQQLRYLREVARQGLNLSVAAEKLHTSQPGISKQIKLLEDELGVQILVRNGKRVVAMTEPGKIILEIAERVLGDSDNLKRVAEEFSHEDTGTLTIATTHTQARYALPRAIKQFTRRYPKVRLRLRQGNPTQIAEMTSSGEADMCIATEAIALFDELVMLPCYDWNRSVIVPPDHPLIKERKISLEAVAKYPIITYDFAFTGSRGLTPNIVLTAIDADVIKTYVELGLGVGIVASMAYDPKRDHHLRAIDASHLFEPSTTRIGLRRNFYLRGYLYDFIELFAPHLNRKAVDAAMAAKH
jgi:LysR family transcriptional regulator, cys regulon transcriptional activator